ncbi:CRAL/TRIO domain containing protein [Aureococcus anophagefferens]|nr:CRAL/TRIO domain containing protein [Aureococcus anophagefferens]
MAVACSVDSFRWIQEENHAVYKVVCRAADEQWSVERRHSEFALLARNARERVGGGVPALPRTRRGWGFDPDMLERRRDARRLAQRRGAPRRGRPVPRGRGERGRGARAGNKAARAKARAQTGGGRAAAAAAAEDGGVGGRRALWMLLAVTTLALGPEAGVACAAAALLGSRAFAASAAPAAVEPSREDPSDGAAKIADEAVEAADAPKKTKALLLEEEDETRSPELKALRIFVVKTYLGGAPIPLALNDDNWLQAALQGLLNRADRHEEWAKWKVWFAIEYRNKAAAADAGPTRVVDARLARVIEDEAGTDVSNADMPLLTSERLARAGRTLREGGLYIYGRDADQRPVVWCRSAKIDMRGLGRAGVKDWVDAVASLFELCCLASNGRPKYGFTYIEHSGDEASRIPAWTGLRVRAALSRWGSALSAETRSRRSTPRINRVLRWRRPSCRRRCARACSSSPAAPTRRSAPRRSRRRARPFRRPARPRTADGDATRRARRPPRKRIKLPRCYG